MGTEYFRVVPSSSRSSDMVSVGRPTEPLGDAAAEVSVRRRRRGTGLGRIWTARCSSQSRASNSGTAGARGPAAA